jgi:hypothetical protein
MGYEFRVMSATHNPKLITHNYLADSPTRAQMSASESELGARPNEKNKPPRKNARGLLNSEPV